MIRISPLVALFIGACALGPSRPEATAGNIGASAIEMFGTQCYKLSKECDVQVIRRGKRWVAFVAPVSRNEQGEKLYAVHSGWNLLFEPDGTFIKDMGW